VTAPPARLAALVVMLGLGVGACDAGGGGTGGVAGSGGGGSGAAGSPAGGAGSGSAGTGSGTAGQGVAGASGVAGSGSAGATAPDAGSPADGGGAAGAHPDASREVGGGDTGTAPLTQLLRIIQITSVQGGATVSISIDRQKNHTGPIHAGQALMLRIHVRPDTGWVPHPTNCELHLVNATMDVTLSATRTITGASSAGVLESTYNFDLTAAQVTKDLQFSVALRDPTGTPADPPPAIQRALYPMTGALDTLDAQ
jgi:hypothetical protein